MSSIRFSQPVRFLAEPELVRAVGAAARQRRTNTSEFLRQAVRAQLAVHGITLPAVSDDDDTQPPRPSLRRAA